MTTRTTDYATGIRFDGSTVDVVNRDAWDFLQRVEMPMRLTTSEVSDQSWFRAPRWQEMKHEADADIAAGRVTRYENVDDFLASLDDLLDE